MLSHTWFLALGIWCLVTDASTGFQDSNVKERSLPIQDTHLMELANAWKGPLGRSIGLLRSNFHWKTVGHGVYYSFWTPVHLHKNSSTPSSFPTCLPSQKLVYPYSTPCPTLHLSYFSNYIVGANLCIIFHESLLWDVGSNKWVNMWYSNSIIPSVFESKILRVEKEEVK